MSTFFYVDMSADINVTGDTLRLTDPEAAKKALENGAAEATFTEWWESLSEEARAEMTDGAEEGTFVSDWGEGPTVCSLEDGEPLESEEEGEDEEEAEEEGEEAAEDDSEPSEGSDEE